MNTIKQSLPVEAPLSRIEEALRSLSCEQMSRVEVHQRFAAAQREEEARPDRAPMVLWAKRHFQESTVDAPRPGLGAFIP
ncbi:hypothetical protein ACNI65_25440 [Roseateles sp. So40a]|uniref:hypothetical protein n=1 Tax=Roseateles sp. So40a TaxID=3400226 RepID=UPI003A839501